ncbi:hypothetical protein UFOVP410_153 [uncultured Caudovirales phage]|uniref:Uncharacterized protein n=1 Tax=uncultured Caudovirales phage TaxID=2100421 RepID=A0A6J5M3G1_9CAUD|nr:hypothetical protein UFOVP410_153 [uncultured Caudovirales phage]
MKCRLVTSAWKYNSATEQEKIELLKKYGVKFSTQPGSQYVVWVEDTESAIVEVNTLEDLLKFIEEFKCAIILRRSDNPEYAYYIMIYDDYIE